MGGARGRKIELRERREVMACITEACAGGARLAAACQVLELSPRTLQRWREEAGVKADARQEAA